MASIIPVMRVFDRKKIDEFYISWLGFKFEWEHNPDGAPFYMRVSIQGAQIDLSEHHGDCSPGAKVYVIDFEGLETYHKALLSKKYPYMRPGLERVEWDQDTLEMTVIDPFYNRIIFTERIDNK